VAQFLNARTAIAQLVDIIDTAAQELVLISPYVHMAADILDRLRDADSRGVRITLVYGKKELDPTERQNLGRFSHLSLYFSERLHAKCYYNEHRMVITSLNLLERSEQNFEMGVSLEAHEEAYAAAVREAKLIIGQAAQRSARKSDQIKKRSGFCIRCSKEIPLDPERPYCNDCFGIWARFENWDFGENVCHRCGRNESTTRARPQCYTCFKTGLARS